MESTAQQERPPLRGIQQRVEEQITLTLQFLRVVAALEVLPSSSGASSSHSPDAVDEALQGFFALFHKSKKVRGWVRTRGRNWVRTLIHGLRLLMPTPWRSRTRFAAGFRGSACGSWSSTWVGAYGGVPVVTGAPAHTHGLSFTRKLQPMSTNSPRTYWSEAVVVASGPGGRAARGEGGRRAAVEVLQVKFYRHDRLDHEELECRWSPWQSAGERNEIRSSALPPTVQLSVNDVGPGDNLHDKRGRIDLPQEVHHLVPNCGPGTSRICTCGTMSTMCAAVCRRTPGCGRTSSKGVGPGGKHIPNVEQIEVHRACRPGWRTHLARGVVHLALLPPGPCHRRSS